MLFFNLTSLTILQKYSKHPLTVNNNEGEAKDEWWYFKLRERFILKLKGTSVMTDLVLCF